MKFIKNGIIYEPHNELVIAQMKKNGYTPYEEAKEETKEETKVETKEETKELTKDTKKKKK